MKILHKMSVVDFQKLHIQAGWKILKDKEVKKSLKKSMFLSSCLIKNEIVGIARIVGDNTTRGLLCDVIVNPMYQGQGIGKALLNDLFEQIQKFVDKHDEFLLEALPTKDKTAFYVKCGFKYAPNKMDGVYKWFKNSNIYKANSKKHIMQLNDNPFKKIKAGQKIIEMRLNDEKRQLIKKNDIIIFLHRQNNNKKLWTRVVDIKKYKNFEQLYKNNNKIDLGYNRNEVAMPSDMQQYYNEENIKKYGVLAIKIQLL